MLKSIRFLFVLGAVVNAGGADSGEAQIWNQEKAYWEYVKANDLETYRALWHDDFVGWPESSTEPAHKDHITDWITNMTAQGLKLQSFEIDQRAIKITGNIAIDHYRIKGIWGKADTGEVVTTDRARITHTWIRTSDGTWKILGGMSAPVNADGK